MARRLAAVDDPVAGWRAAGWAFIADFAAITVACVVLGRAIAGVGVRLWAKKVLLPSAAFAVALALFFAVANAALAPLLHLFPSARP